jgi:hypothetical protein
MSAKASVMAWRDVTSNVTQQRDTYSLLASSSESIEDYYPELHKSKVAGQFVNTTGVPLIADLISAPHVICDLYPYADESELISRYGVDLQFLLALRDRELITLTANADYERYRECPWMYEVLADQRTVFRSIRTPLFFRSLFPDIMEERNDLKNYLERRFRGMPSNELEAVIAASLHFQKPTPESLAGQLSWEWMRVEAMSKRIPSDNSYSIDDLIRRPEARRGTRNIT